MTHPERFGPLHDVALEVLDDLVARFAVAREEGVVLDANLAAGPLVRAMVRLTPEDASAAPLTVAFTNFPGLVVRSGLWSKTQFPDCGCDACDETAESASEGFRGLVDAVTTGGFREAIDLPLVGRAMRSERFSSSRGIRAGETLVERSDARRLLSQAGRVSYEWRPWPLRA